MYNKSMNETTKKIINAFETRGYSLDVTNRLEDDVDSLLAELEADLNFLKLVKVNKTTKIVELNRTQRTVYEFVKDYNFFGVQENVKKGYIMTNRTYKKINKTKFLIKQNNKKIELKNKKGIIIGFKDNTPSGKGQTYYGLKKNTPENATPWTAHGDFSKISKFLKIAKGAQVDDPSKLLQKILDDKGITKLMGDKSVLTLNDVLSHERYFSNISNISPRK